MTDTTTSPEPLDIKEVRRRPGRPSTISRSAVLAAARRLPAEELSMQAVATQLGVARRSVGHYVSGIDELRMLVAAADLAEGLTSVELPQGDWRAAVRSYAQAVHDVVVANPMCATILLEIPLSGPLALVEHLIEALVDAGFEPSAAANALEMVGDVTLAGARREVLAQGIDPYPAASDAWEIVNQDHGRRFVQLRTLLADRHTAPHAVDASFPIDIIIKGLESLKPSDL